MRLSRFPRRAFSRAARHLVLATAVASCWSTATLASRHREAPFIATQPQVDATDLYMFRSCEPGRDG